MTRSRQAIPVLFLSYAHDVKDLTAADRRRNQGLALRAMWFDVLGFRLIHYLRQG